jgi:MYXO-CTERM domain-containing protein
MLIRIVLTAAAAGLITGAAGASSITLNEIRIDQPSTDNDEYFELFGLPGESLEGLTYIVIGDGTGGSGVIEAVIPLSGLVIPADGYFLAIEETFSLVPQENADLILAGNGLNFENSDNVTHRLVSNFTGSLGDDLDIDDDGTLDFMPWDAVLDSIALVEDDPNNPPPAGEWWYGPTIGPDGGFVPGHVYRFENGLGPWNIGQFDPIGGQDTPGFANVPGPGALALLGLAGLLGRRRRR